jgi:hypothetical protein
VREASGVINVFRYTGAAIVIAVGSLAFSAFGIAELNNRLDAAGVARPEEEQLDQVLTGSPSATSEANQLQGEQRQAFVSGAQHGTIDGFDAAMLVIAIGSLGGAVGWLVLVPPARRRRGSRPSPSSVLPVLLEFASTGLACARRDEAGGQDRRRRLPRRPAPRAARAGGDVRVAAASMGRAHRLVPGGCS